MELITRVPAAPARPSNAHKGTFGTVVVIGGQPNMIGAPAISATAALRSGVGLCKIMTNMQSLPHILTIQPSATAVCLPDDTGEAVEQLQGTDPQGRSVLAIGPGFGTSESRQDLVDKIVCHPNRWRIVLDADGLNLLAKTGKSLKDFRDDAAPPIVLTPHPGEFRRLAAPLDIQESPVDEDQRVAGAEKLAKAHNAVVVLKGNRTVVTDGERYYLNDTGNPCLSTAGSGDVLTGIISALMAQGMSEFDAAVLGVSVHGQAADQWAEINGPAGMLAMELCHELPKALNKLRKKAE